MERNDLMADFSEGKEYGKVDAKIRRFVGVRVNDFSGSPSVSVVFSVTGGKGVGAVGKIKPDTISSSSLCLVVAMLFLSRALLVLLDRRGRSNF